MLPEMSEYFKALKDKFIQIIKVYYLQYHIIMCSMMAVAIKIF